MKSKSPSMRATVVWAIRDARKLSALEKSFLYTVESRGEMTASAERAAGDMGLGRTSFYEVRVALESKGLLLIGEVPGRPTRYRVSEAGLSRWQAEHAITEHEVDWVELERAASAKATVRRADSAVRRPTPEVQQEVEPEAHLEAGQEAHLEASPGAHLEARPEGGREVEPEPDPGARIGVDPGVEPEIDIEVLREANAEVKREAEPKSGRYVRPQAKPEGPNSECDSLITAQSAPRDERGRLDQLDAQFSSNLEELVLNGMNGGSRVLIDDVLDEWEPPSNGQGERTVTWTYEVLPVVSVYSMFARRDPTLWQDGHFKLEINVGGRNIEMRATFDGLAGLAYLDPEFRSELRVKADEYLNGASESSRVAEESQG